MKENRLMKIITFPKKALAKAGEFYVNTMNSFADNSAGYSYGAASFGLVEPLPRSFSTSSARSSHVDNDHLKGMIRAASSSRAYAKKLDLTALDHTPTTSNGNNNDRAKGSAMKGGVQRSASVSMTKIEEDNSAEFEDDESKNVKEDKMKKKEKNGKGLFGKSKSYAVSSSTVKRF